MIGSKRNDSSTIRATPSANGEERSSLNFSINSSARSDEGSRGKAGLDAGVTSTWIRRACREPSFRNRRCRQQNLEGYAKCAGNPSQGSSLRLARATPLDLVESGPRNLGTAGQFVWAPSLRITKIADLSR